MSDGKKKSEVGRPKSEKESNSEIDIPQSATKEELPTGDSKLQTEKMEVHHHPDVEKKGFKEYVLEFLMIFLAVTMGFFAENIREHIADTEKARQYAKSLYDDLKEDTTVISRTYKEKDWIIAKFDSAENILSANDGAKNNEFLYYIERYTINNDVFTIQDVTYQQLRSSGNFRYIKDVNLYKNLAGYYSLYTRYQSMDGAFGSMDVNEVSAIESKLFDPHDLTSLDNDKANSFYNVSLPSKRPLKPISGSKEDLNSFYLKVHNVRQKSIAARTFLAWLKGDAAKLMTDLKKEYDLE